MRRLLVALAALASLGPGGASGGPKADPPDVLAARSSPPGSTGTPRAAPPSRYRLTDACFYPASTVKLPAAVLVLEKLNDVAVPA